MTLKAVISRCSFHDSGQQLFKKLERNVCSRTLLFSSTSDDERREFFSSALPRSIFHSTGCRVSVPTQGSPPTGTQSPQTLYHYTGRYHTVPMITSMSRVPAEYDSPRSTNTRFQRSFDKNIHYVQRET